MHNQQHSSMNIKGFLKHSILSAWFIFTNKARVHKPESSASCIMAATTQLFYHAKVVFATTVCYVLQYKVNGHSLYQWPISLPNPYMIILLEQIDNHTFLQINVTWDTGIVYGLLYTWSWYCHSITQYCHTGFIHGLVNNRMLTQILFTI